MIDAAEDGSLLTERATEGENDFSVSVDGATEDEHMPGVPPPSIHLLPRSTDSSDHPTNESIIHPTK